MDDVDEDDILLQDLPASGKEAVATSVQDKAYLPVTPEDVRAAFAGVLISKANKDHPTIYMAPRFLLEVCQGFYERLNAKELRRNFQASTQTTSWRRL